MLIKHRINDVIRSLNIQDVSEMFAEALQLLRDAKVVYKELLDFKAGNVEDFEAADDLEPYTTVQYNSIAKFRTWKSSANALVNKYLEKMYPAIPVYEKNLIVAVDCAMQIQDSELDKLITQTYKVISGMGFLLVLEFELFEIPTMNDGTELDIDEVFDAYCKRTTEDPYKLAASLVQVTEEFPIKLELFDANPEYEEAFYKIMGPDAAYIDESKLTIDMVYDVVSGNKTPEELIQYMNELIAKEQEAEEMGE